MNDLLSCNFGFSRNNIRKIRIQKFIKSSDADSSCKSKFTKKRLLRSEKQVDLIFKLLFNYSLAIVSSNLSGFEPRFDNGKNNAKKSATAVKK